MTPERIEQERMAFEEWISNPAPPVPIDPCQKQKDGRYAYDHIEFAWRAWQARASQSEWISVKDRLPESSKRYLTFSSFYMRIITAYYSVDRRMWLGVCRTDGITHWQPFPAPPTTNPAA